jgi:hypothetical protein
MSYEAPRIKNVKGRVIEIEHLELPTQIKTYLTSAVSATGTTLTVIDSSGFANTDPIRIGELGNEGTEIKKVNGAVSSMTSLTTTALSFNHPIGTNVYKMLFNQWKIYGASTLTGSKTLIATVDMQVGEPYTTYVNTGTEYTYYFVLPYDSLNSVTGDAYSDGVAKTTGYQAGTVGSLIDKAMVASKSEFNEKITSSLLIGEINDCLRFMSGKLKRWSGLQCFDYSLGVTSLGVYKYAMPSDIEDANSIKSILEVRIGDGILLYKDKREWDERLEDTKHTLVTTQATAGDTTLAINNSYDFADSGTVDIFVSGTEYNITYTGVTRSTTAGVLTGVPASGTGSITVTIPASTDVWQDEEDGQPTYFTVYDGYLYIWPLPSSSYDNMNVWIDYYTAKTNVDSYSDTLEFSRYDAVKHWLIWKLRSLKDASGKLDLQDGDFQMFNAILNEMIRKEISGQRHKLKPKVNTISY